MSKMTNAFLPAVALLLGSCAAVPSGPGVLVLPGTGKTFDQFRGDDVQCRQFASLQTGGRTPGRAATAAGVGAAAVGTAIGAATGAAIGGGEGAAIGAGTGLAAGSLVGTGTGSTSADTAQERYDMGYIQCMYAKGHRVPVPGNVSYEDRRAPYPPPPPPSDTPPK
jgi:outer membrane lipoprotein SlyB